MSQLRNPATGSTFDSFLEEEGIKHEVEAAAKKRAETRRYSVCSDKMTITLFRVDTLKEKACRYFQKYKAEISLFWFNPALAVDLQIGVIAPEPVLMDFTRAWKEYGIVTPA